MVSINYSRLFNLKFSHSYYGIGPVPGLTLIPAAQTSRLFKRSKILFKQVPNGVVCLYRAEADETTPVIELSPSQRFTFFLTANEIAQFLSITHLDVSPEDRFNSGSLLFFTNDPASASSDPEAPEEMEHSLLDGVQGHLFSYSFRLDTSPAEVLLRISDRDGNTVPAGRTSEGALLPDPLPVTKGEDDSYRQQIDLRNRPPGVYTFTIRNLADDTTLREEKYYVDDELPSPRLLGIVQIVYSGPASRLYNSTEEYELSFQSKSSVWRYIIANRYGSYSFSSLNLIIDNDGSDDTFSLEGDVPSSDVSVDGFETIVFKSDAPISHTLVPISGIQLRDTISDTVLISDLPNPSASNIEKENNGQIESDLYVYF